MRALQQSRVQELEAHPLHSILMPVQDARRGQSVQLLVSADLLFRYPSPFNVQGAEKKWEPSSAPISHATRSLIAQLESDLDDAWLQVLVIAPPEVGAEPKVPPERGAAGVACSKP